MASLKGNDIRKRELLKSLKSPFLRKFHIES